MNNTTLKQLAVDELEATVATQDDEPDQPAIEVKQAFLPNLAALKQVRIPAQINQEGRRDQQF